MLRGIAVDPIAAALLASARLFSSALDLMRFRPEVSFVLLVSSAETMANAVLEEWEPTAAEKTESRRAFLSAIPPVIEFGPNESS
jgi:hypothetical protein